MNPKIQTTTNDERINDTQAVLNAFNEVFADQGPEVAAKLELKIKKMK